MNRTLTADRARDLLAYNPETGMLHWRAPTSRHSRITIGTEAGYIRSNGYRYIKIDGRDYLAHRLAFLIITNRWPHDQIDHINGRKSDNSWLNLREADHRENHRNQRLPRNNTSGHIGVRWHNRDKRWQAYIKLNGRRKHLGYFHDLEKAVSVRKAAERKHGYHINHGRGEKHYN